MIATRGPVAGVPYEWRSCGVARLRISTTVDEHLLEQARAAKAGAPDSALIDDALTAFLARKRAAEIDAAYAAYDDHPWAKPTTGVTWRRSGLLQRPRDLAARTGRRVVVRATRGRTATCCRPVP